MQLKTLILCDDHFGAYDSIHGPQAYRWVTLGQDKFSERLLNWFDQHGRHNLPWQAEKSLYRVWVSEIMLQQTQVGTVIPYYQRFMQRFPSLKVLAVASVDDVLAYWAGLGYYARGRNLHKAASIIQTDYQGEFPADIDLVNALPGIGRSTAGAILSLALNQRHAILDGNVKRVLCRYHGIIDYPEEKKVETKLWQLAERHTPHCRNADYTQAIMDLGAMVCTRSKPNCQICPQQQACVAYAQDKIDQIPRPKAKRHKPQKHCAMLALIDARQQLSLFKRPASGIWGSLYSLPEFTSTKACLDMLEKCNINISKNTRLETKIRHSFTHFDLDITPIICFAKKAHYASIRKQLTLDNTHGVLPQERVSYSLHVRGTKPGIGIPAPVQKFITQLGKQ